MATLHDARVRLSESVCPLEECKVPRVVLDVACGSDSRPYLAIPELDPGASALGDDLNRRSVWTKGLPIERLAEPCLLVAAEATGVSVGELTLWIAHALGSVVGPRGGRHVCRHAIELDGRLCTTLAHELGQPGGEAVTGLIHVADLLDALPARPADDVMYLDCATFEASPKELALSYRELMGLETWVTGNCEVRPALTEPRRTTAWGHMLFVSHAWRGNEPGTREDLVQIKRVVADYVSEALQKADQNRYGINTNVVKNVASEDDFGIWIDFMIVPNDPAHEGCARCRAERDRHIAQIGSLLTISTIIAMDPEKNDRGWLIHELTGNSHDNIVHGRNSSKLDASALRHRHRAQLMAASPEKLFRVAEDGRKLRCYELPRLGQMPRCWPSVNEQLLSALKSEGVTDERSREAAPALYAHARRFDRDCHDLKLAMIEVTQALARTTSTPAAPVDLTGFATAVENQATAMRRLHDQLQPGPEQDHDLLPIDDAIMLARRLQTQQFVEVALGLRAETTRHAGFGSWVKLTELVDALAATKFMARLLGGLVTGKKVSCNVTLDEGSTEARKQGAVWARRLSLAEDAALRGVRADALQRAYQALSPASSR